jgi:hypothetical protein
MTTLRILVFGLVLGCVGMAAPGTRADTAGMQPTPDADAARLSAQDAWNGPGDLYRIIASSAGVLAGAGLMSVFIDGWVLDAFTSNSGLSAREAAAVVRDLESQGGIEAAAILLAGLAGGLVADHVYVDAGQVLPDAFESTSAALKPSVTAIGKAWAWVSGRVGDAGDWVQARSREFWDRWLQ